MKPNYENNHNYLKIITNIIACFMTHSFVIDNDHGKLRKIHELTKKLHCLQTDGQMDTERPTDRQRDRWT